MESVFDIVIGGWIGQLKCFERNATISEYLKETFFFESYLLNSEILGYKAVALEKKRDRVAKIFLEFIGILEHSFL